MHQIVIIMFAVYINHLSIKIDMVFCKIEAVNVNYNLLTTVHKTSTLANRGHTSTLFQDFTVGTNFVQILKLFSKFNMSIFYIKLK